MSGASNVPTDVPSMSNGGGIDIDALSEAFTPEFAELGVGSEPGWVYDALCDFVHELDDSDGEVTIQIPNLATYFEENYANKSSRIDVAEAFSDEVGVSGILHVARHVHGDDVVVNIIGESDGMRIEDVRSADVGSLVSIDCRVTDRSTVHSTTRVGAFDCRACSATRQKVQDIGTDGLSTPRSCSDECDYDFSTGDFNEDYSTYLDFQEVIIQDMHAAASGANPSDMLAVVLGGQVMSVDSGADLTVTAVVRRAQDAEDMLADLYLQVVGIEQRDEDYSSVEVSPEEEARIQKIAESESVHSRLAASIAPTIKGDYSLQRRAGLYMLAGGSSRMDMRKQIHALYIGDPSTGKSKMARYINKVSPTSEYASGDSSSSVGLTAAVEREERFSAAEWTVAGGVVVRADSGHAVIDELDKASEGERKSLHEPLSEQQVSVNKASINATLRARCAALLVANPVDDRFRPNQPLSSQFNLNDAIRSRMDVIIPFRDVPGDDDKSFARKMMDSVQDEEGVLSADFLRKYIAYARRNYDPILTDAAKDVIASWWADLRQEAESSTAVSVDTRRLEAAQRIAAASAKLRLSDESTAEDAERAVELMDEWMDILMRDEYGCLDVDRVSSSTTASERDRKQAFCSALDIHGGDDGRVHRDVIVSHMVAEEGIEKQSAQQEINRIAGAGKDATYDEEDSSYILDLR